MRCRFSQKINHVFIRSNLIVSEARDFDLNRLKERVSKINPSAKVIAYSAKTGENVDEWVDWLRTKLQDKK